MKILVLLGSPRRISTSSALAENFIAGALSVGHEVKKISVSNLKINYCSGCNACKKTGGCILKDDFNLILKEIKTCDCLVIASPTYFYGLSAQIKTVIDRLHSVNEKLKKKKLITVLLTTCADSNPSTPNAINTQYNLILEYYNWQNAGIINALGVANVNNFVNTNYLNNAFNLGKSLK